MKVLVAAALAVGSASMASAASFIVDAYANSSSGGTGSLPSPSPLAKATPFRSPPMTYGMQARFPAGPMPTVSSPICTPRDPMIPANWPATQIGAAFGAHTQGNLTAAFGTLVGQIDSGDYFVVGTNFAGTADATGTLKLFYWDSNFGDNTQYITADVQAVPEPATMAVLGLGLLGLVRRRKASK